MVDQELAVFFVAVVDEHLDGGLALLRVARLVRLDARYQRAELQVADVDGVRDHAEELQVRKTGLQREGELDRDGQRVVGDEHVVEEVPYGQGDPVVGVERFQRPVAARLLAEQAVREERLDLAVPYLVQRAERRGVAPGGGAPEPAHAGLAEGRQVLRHRDRAVVRDDHGLPARIELVEQLRAADGVLQRVGGGVLGDLVVDVFAVTDLVGLVPGQPRLGRDTTGTRQFFGEHVGLVDVAERPVRVTCQVIPVAAGEPGHREISFAAGMLTFAYAVSRQGVQATVKDS